MPDIEQNNQTKPLSLVEKTTIAAKSFVKSAIEYVPSGLMYSALFLGGSLAISALTGGASDIAGVLAASGGVNLKALAVKAIGTLALGSAVTGSIGAYQGVSAANEQRESEMEWQQRGQSISPQARGRQRSQATDMGDPAPQRGLPPQKQAEQHVVPGY